MIDRWVQMDDSNKWRPQATVFDSISISNIRKVFCLQLIGLVRFNDATLFVETLFLFSSDGIFYRFFFFFAVNLSISAKWKPQTIMFMFLLWMILNFPALNMDTHLCTKYWTKEKRKEKKWFVNWSSLGTVHCSCQTYTIPITYAWYTYINTNKITDFVFHFSFFSEYIFRWANSVRMQIYNECTYHLLGTRYNISHPIQTHTTSIHWAVSS